MLSAAEILYQKIRLSYSLEFQKTPTGNAPKGAKKKLQEIPLRNILLKKLSCIVFRAPLGAVSCQLSENT